ncbi:MAG: hypothetical protein NC350_04040 [Corallococcus sp.]|nr:hypothetical protein [Corallococcus sp.]
MKNKNNKQKVKIVYKEDTGETVYSMASLEGLTPEQVEERHEQRKKRFKVTRKEKKAMISAAYQVYLVPILCLVGAFALVAVIFWLLLR